MNAAVRNGRETVARVKSLPHHEGDGYSAGACFFTTPREPKILQEGLALVCWGLEQAEKTVGVFGYHMIPEKSVARAQVAALTKHLDILPEVLGEYGILMRNISSSGLAERKARDDFRQLAEPLLRQLFVNRLTSEDGLREARTALNGLNKDATTSEFDGRHACLKRYLTALEDAEVLTSYFCLSLPTLARALELSRQP